MAREPIYRRESILDAAATLFARKGISATTVREIADEVGMGSGSLYHHFESKEAIADEVISSYLEDLRGRYKQVLASDVDPRRRLHDMIVVSLQVVEMHPHATEIYQNDVNYLSQFERFSYLKNAGREVQNAWLEVIDSGIRQGVFRSDLDPKILYRLMRDAVWLSVRWFKQTRQYPISRLAEDYTSLFVEGLARSGR
jgi:AcrR family transcriptional regulator